MSAKILLSILALGGVGMVALPADVLQKPNSQPVASRLDKTEPTQQVASLQPPAAVSTGQAANTATAAETPAAATPAFPPANAELATVGDSNLNARQGPATSFAKVFVVAAGEQLQVIDKNGMWVQVRRNTGESGWVHSSYL